VRTVLFHGFTGGARSFAHLGLDAVTPELPGHGRAAPPRSWEDALQRLEPLLDPGPVVLGGYSMGARLALALALRRPERVARLVLASGTAGIDGEAERAERRRSDEELARSIEERGVARFVQQWERQPMLALQPFQMEQLRTERLQHEAAGLASALRQLGTGAQPSYWAALQPLAATPVTLLAGERDAKFTALARRLHALLPRSTLRVLPCGHVIHVEEPEAFTGALR
jgi:2-succinyl-6-hydroxy-2,4-cyclohexadiene-1-carboxylate synthase